MIPIQINSSLVSTYTQNVIAHIKSKGKDKYNRLEKYLKLVDPGLTFSNIFSMSLHDLEQYKAKYKVYMTSLSFPDKSDKKYRSLIRTYNEQSFHLFQRYYDEIFEGVKGVNFIDSLGVLVCPYCNRVPIHSAKKVRTAQIDHFIPQSEYPIFALSIFNLIPVCPICNKNKLDNIFNLLSPYDRQLTNETFRFQAKKEIDGSYSILFKPSDKKNQKYVDDMNTYLKIQELYLKEKDFVNKLYDKSQMYSEDSIRCLKENFKNMKNVKYKESEFIRSILDNYGDDSDFLTYVYAKATRDIADEFGLLNLLKLRL